MNKPGRPKGGKNRGWSKEGKLRIVLRYLDERIGQHELARQEGISRGILYKWIETYLEQGESGLESNRKTGNPYAALHTSKSLTELERLRLTVAKQQVEIARLKNGYRAEGSGVGKELVTLSGASIKSSKK